MSSLAEVKTPFDHVSDGGIEGDWEAVSSKVIVLAAGTASKYVDVAGKFAAMLSSIMMVWKLRLEFSSINGVNWCSISLCTVGLVISCERATSLAGVLGLGASCDILRSGTRRLKLGKKFWTYVVVMKDKYKKGGVAGFQLESFN